MPKVTVSSSPWTVQSKVTSANIPHNNAPTVKPKVGQLSQADTYGRAMAKAYKGTKTFGSPQL